MESASDGSTTRARSSEQRIKRTGLEGPTWRKEPSVEPGPARGRTNRRLVRLSVETQPSGRAVKDRSVRARSIRWSRGDGPSIRSAITGHPPSLHGRLARPPITDPRSPIQLEIGSNHHDRGSTPHPTPSVRRTASESIPDFARHASRGTSSPRARILPRSGGDRATPS